MMGKKPFILLAGVLSVLLILAGCRASGKISDNSAKQSSAPAVSLTEQKDNKENFSSQTENKTENKENAEMKMKVQVGNYTFTATLENNVAANAFSEMTEQAPVIVEMSDYSGFEKVGSLDTSLPTDNRQTATHEGDIVLYNGNQIVIFYGSNSWSYTRLGKIDNPICLKEALGNDDITVTFYME